MKKRAMISNRIFEGFVNTGWFLPVVILAALLHSRLFAHRGEDAILWMHPGAYRDLELSEAAFLFAGLQPKTWRGPRRNRVFAIGRVLFAITAAVLGLLHFIYPEFAEGGQMQFPLPSQPMWSYLTGVTFLGAGAAIFLNSKVRLAASVLGMLILLLGLIVWVPWLLTHPEDAVSGNYLKDIGLASGALLLAGALPKRDG